MNLKENEPVLLGLDRTDQECFEGSSMHSWDGKSALLYRKKASKGGIVQYNPANIMCIHWMAVSMESIGIVRKKLHCTTSYLPEDYHRMITFDATRLHFQN